MQLRHLSSAAVILAAMSVMAEGAWADAPDGASAPRVASRAPVHKAAFHRRQPKPASPDHAAIVVPPSFDVRGESRFEPAPVPSDAAAPASRTPEAATAEPHMFAVKTQFRGDGYPYGATPQGFDNRNDVTVPGVDVTLPLVERPSEGIR